MIDVLTFETAHLFGDALPSAHRLRHRIFVERQKYDVPTYKGLEWDQFDTPAAVQLVWRDERGEVRGVTRLIPTTRPYMIQELWPDLVEGGEVPVRPDVWEITRFGVDRSLDPAQRRTVFGELVAALFEFALANGIAQYVCVTALKVLQNAIGAAGCPVEILGAPRKLGGLPVVAGRFAVNEADLARIRRFHGVPGTVLRTVPHGVPGAGGAALALAA